MVARTDPARRELLTRLATLPLFAGLDAASLGDLADAMHWLPLRGGETLFEQGEESDSLYLLMYGRLAAVRTGHDGQPRAIGSVAPGECVGEIGLITRQPRMASVSALRDSELLRLPRSAFEKLVALHPAAMLGMAKIALKRTGASQGAPATPHCFAVVPTLPGLDAEGFARQLAQALGADPARALVSAAEARDRDAGWFNAREARSSHLFYVGTGDAEWRERCLRQSDCVLLLGDGQRPPPPETERPAADAHRHVPQHLVLLQHGRPQHGSTRIWRAAFPRVQEQHHVRDASDMGRLARRLSGRAVGLVLSGGGARGFAHIGVLRALREAGIVIDTIGGASIGAVIGAGIAEDWPEERLLEAYRESFVRTNPLSDWTLPLVSLRAGRKVSALLRRAHGEADIEDLPLPFFCVSSNLTAGLLELHTQGTLWPALRASCAIPGVLPPVLSRGRVLVDGGVIDNLPVAEMRKRLAGEIIAVDVGGNYRLETSLEETELPPWWRLLPEFFGLRRRPGLGQILLRSGMVNSAATAQRRRRLTRLLLRPELPGIELLDWKKFDRVIELGYQYTRRRLDESREALLAEPALIRATTAT
jgi:NTE family protein